MRLNRYLASAGLGSRRGVEELIKSGRVKINGRPVIDLATKVEPTDTVKVGSRVVRVEHTLSAVLNKPRGFVCTAADELDRRTIFDLLPDKWPRVFHVGRLDKESEGLLIVTNDGDLSLAITHPSHQVEKEYEVGIDKPFDSALREKLLRGIRIEGGLAKVEQINVVTPQMLKLVLRQGIKRQIRLMMYSLGYEVTHLRRIRVGPLRLAGLNPGEWRLLTPKEIETLKSTKALPRPPRPPRPAKPVTTAKTQARTTAPRKTSLAARLKNVKSAPARNRPPRESI